MSNNTYLLTTKGPDKPRYGKDSATRGLLVASTSIPVFWYMLFDETSLVLGPARNKSESPYHHLTTATAEGLARAESHWPAVSTVIGSKLASLFQTWLSFVREHALKYIHCETAEWSWMFDTPEAFEKELRACLRAVKRRRPKSDRGLPAAWIHLLGQAHVGFRRGKPYPLGNLSYCGGSFGLEVPWSEETNVCCGSLSERARKTPAFGAGPGDLRPYLEQVWGPINAYRQAVCSCKGLTFRLQVGVKYDAVVKRTCIKCGKGRVIGGEYHLDTYMACEDPDETVEEFLRRIGLKDWVCAGCGHGEANVGVGFEMEDDGESVKFMEVAVRCVSCGRLGYCAGWEEWHRTEMFDEV
jgi:hypothetical protein